MPFLSPYQATVYDNITKYGENRNMFFSYTIQLMELRSAYRDLLESNDDQVIAKVEDAIVTYADADFFLRGTQVVNGTIALILMCLCLLRIRELFTEVRAKTKMRFGFRVAFAKVRASGKWNVPFLLVLYNLSTVAVNSTDFAIADNNLSDEQKNFLWKCYTVGYIWGNWVLYGILYLRCASVLDSPLFASHVRIKRLQRTVQLILMVFGLYTIVPFYAVYGVYIPDHFLTYHLNPIFVYIFLIADTIFSLLLLGLFIYPVLKVIQANDDLVFNASTSKFRHVLKRNLVLSSIAIASTFVSMLFAAQVDMLCNGLPSISNLDLQWYRPLSQAIINIDMIINMVVGHLITSMWLPNWVKMKINRDSANVESTGTTANTNENTMISPLRVDTHAQLSFYKHISVLQPRTQL